MLHKISFKIEVDITTHSYKKSQEIHGKLTKALIADTPESLSFEVLDKIIDLRARNFHVSEVEYSRQSHDSEESSTKFKIKG